MSIYLDHNATTPLDPRVLEAMLPWLREGFGNPSSNHRHGRAARSALDVAREQVAALAGAHPSQVVFTCGGTEANNAALKGAALSHPGAGIAVSAVEHASVLESAKALARQGWPVRYLEVDAAGRVEPEGLVRRLAGMALVSIMAANNETGVVQELAPLAEAARRAGCLFHTDAVQALGKIDLDFRASGAHLMSLSAHKIGGPKGAGALLVDKAVDWEPLLHGGGQERGRRGGTENVAALVGFGAAAELARAEQVQRRQRWLALRAHLERLLREQLPEAVVLAAQAQRLLNTVFLALPGVDGETLLVNLDRRGFALSSGAACGSGEREPSHVLAAMGVDPDLAQGAVRVSMGIGNCEQELDALVAALGDEYRRLRGLAAASWA